MTAHVVTVLMGGLFHAAILFLVAAGLQVVFGVQRIFNLACGSFTRSGRTRRPACKVTTEAERGPVHRALVAADLGWGSSAGRGEGALR